MDLWWRISGWLPLKSLRPKTAPQRATAATLQELSAPMLMKMTETAPPVVVVVVLVKLVAVVVRVLVVVGVHVVVVVVVVVVVRVAVEVWVVLVVVVVLVFMARMSTSVALMGLWNSPCAHAGGGSRNMELVMENPKFAIIRSYAISSLKPVFKQHVACNAELMALPAGAFISARIFVLGTPLFTLVSASRTTECSPLKVTTDCRALIREVRSCVWG
mmetsp:Transcript_66005/g.182784  ORF Transcript_66005/g.182784 Transcript_66005/m.182784 type:complete len:217 (-) Transcript_66005:371-1021(-)